MMLAMTLCAHVAGCDPAGGCRELCEKDDECLGGIDVDACVATCEDLSETDEAYADGVAERAGCVEGLSCDAIFQECRPSGG
jgi:hypothetical protein